MPRVSFVVPCFNYGRFLNECIGSILAQTFSDFEILICDDASTDDTPVLATGFIDSRIRYIRREQNIGHLENYNDGIRQAQGELVWLISADDKLGSNRVLETYVDQFNQHPDLMLACCRVQCIDDDSAPYDKFIPRSNYPGLPTEPRVFDGADFYRVLIQGNFVASPCALAKKSLYEKFGYFHPDLPHSGDWYNWLLFGLEGKVYYDPDALVLYRKHQNNMHVSYDKPQHAIDNTLLCYDLLLEKIPENLAGVTKLARIHYKKQHKQSLSLGEKAQRALSKLTGY